MTQSETPSVRVGAPLEGLTTLAGMTAAPGVTIRTVLAEDAEALADLHVDVWEAAYTGLIPARVLQERRAALPERVARWREIVARSPAQTTIAESATGLVGFISVGPPRDGDVHVAEEVWALYVDAAWWGRGVGHDLLTSTLDDRPAYLWVLRGNDRAVAFYRRHGFREDGTVRRDELGTELRMTRP